MNEILNILGSVGFNWHVALANFFNFLIIFFLLKTFFFKKIGHVLDERHKVIEEGIAHAKEAEHKLLHAEEEKQLILRGAYKEKDTILANAESLAHDTVSTLTAHAETEINARVSALKAKEDSLLEIVEKAFNEKAPTLVAALYAKTLSKEMTKEDNDALIARMNA